MANNQGPKLIIDDDWKKRSDEPVPAKAAPAPATSPGGIVIDSDWKSQAQAEKDRLAAEEAKKAAESQARGRGAGEPQALDFNGIVEMLASQAMMYLGAVPDPETGRAMVAPEYARLQIDMLVILEEKTKGNLTAEEADLLKKAIHSLRMLYVKVSQAVEQMMREKAARGSAGGKAGDGLGGISGPGIPPMGGPTGLKLT